MTRPNFDPKTPSQKRKTLFDLQSGTDGVAGDLAALTVNFNALAAKAVTADSVFGTDNVFIVSDGTVRKAKSSGILFDTDGTLAANSDTRIASQKAVKTYVDASIAGSTVADGDYGDIIVSGTGTVWTFDPTVVTTFARTFLNDADAAAVRSTLGLVIGTDVQAWDADLDALAGLTSAADKLPYFTGSHTAAVTTLTSFARTLLDDVDAATMRSTLGLGTISTQDASNVTITGGSVTGITDLAVADGGTGASTASGARTNLGLAIGTDVEAWDADLDALAAVSYSADTIPYFTGAHAAAATMLTSFGRGLIDDANAVAARTTLGVVIGTDVQAWDADLDALAGVTSAADTIAYFTGAHTASPTTLTSFGRSLIDDTTAANARTTLGLAIGTDVQAWDTDLDALAGVTYAADTIAYFTGVHAASPTTLTSFGRSLIDDASASVARTTLGLGTVATLASDTDGTLAANSDSNVATQKATKTYVDAQANLHSAISIEYTFDSTTTASDPGNGKFRLNNATQGSATSMYADNLDFQGNSWGAILDTLASNLSPIYKSHIRLVDKADHTKWILFTASVVTDSTGYRTLTVSFVAQSGTNPLTNGSNFFFIASVDGAKGTTGDTGATGAAGALVRTSQTGDYSANVNDLVDMAITASHTVTFPTSPAVGSQIGVFLRSASDGTKLTVKAKSSGGIFKNPRNDDSGTDNNIIEMSATGAYIEAMYVGSDTWIVYNFDLFRPSKVQQYFTGSGTLKPECYGFGDFTNDATIELPVDPALSTKCSFKIQSLTAGKVVTIRAVVAGGGHIIGQGDEGNTIGLYVTGDFIELQYSGSNFWQVVADCRIPHKVELTGDATTGQSLTHNTDTTANFTVSLVDNVGAGSTSSDNITIKRAGRYAVAFGFGVNGASSLQYAVAKLKVNGTLARTAAQDPNANTGFDVPTFGSVIIELAAADVLTLILFQFSTGSAARTVLTAVEGRSRLSIAEIR